MLGDIYSTLTLSGSYARAVRRAQEKAVPARQRRCGNAPSAAPRRQSGQTGPLTRLLARLRGGRAFRPARGAPRIPAE